MFRQASIIALLSGALAGCNSASSEGTSSERDAAAIGGSVARSSGSSGTVGTAGAGTGTRVPDQTPPVVVGGSSAPAAPAPVPRTANTAPVSPAVAGASSMAPAAPQAGSSAPTSSKEPVIPKPMGECPKMVTGTFSFMGKNSQIWVGTKSASQKAPIMIYWHGTGGTPATGMAEIDQGLAQMIMSSGGVIASIAEGLEGSPLDWGVFTTGDFATVDQIVACAVEQLNIDTTRIFTSGASAGGLAAGALAYGRSSYIAGALPNSGGQAGYGNLMVLQDPAHVPAVMTMHGARGVDMVVIDFGDSSLREDIDIAKKGGFAVDCDHGGGHVAAPAQLKAAGTDFLMKHPFGFGTSPYAGGLPATYPTYCKIVTKDTPMPMPAMRAGTAGAAAPRRP